MRMKFDYLIVFLATTSFTYGQQTYRICVTDENKDACDKLVAEYGNKSPSLSCVHVRDRFECLQKIKSKEIDFAPVEPEDMFIAAQLSSTDFTVFKSIRDKSDLNSPFRYEAVAVVHSDFNFNKIQELKGRNSCHTGVGRTVGFKIPVTKLSHLNILEPLADDEILTGREHELRALSRAFDKACIVGKWAPDNDTDKRLKQQYSNLCSLCEDPVKCDYPDKYSGYDGALLCLKEKGGHVAWTKKSVARSFFGLSEGSNKRADPSKFAYLCPDGTLMPIETNPPCNWAERPWLGYITYSDFQQIEELRKLIHTLEEVSSNAYLVLELNDRTTTIDVPQVSPTQVLTDSRYIDVIDRKVGNPSPLRLCVRSTEEKAKCDAMSYVAYSRDIRPKISCVLKSSTEECLQTLKDQIADAVTVDPEDAYIASRQFSQHAILAEEVPSSWESEHFVVAIREESSLTNFSNFIACFSEYSDLIGWKIPVSVITGEELPHGHDCLEAHLVHDVFPRGVCAPGSKNKISVNLCSQCSTSECSTTNAEKYYGETGALKCMTEKVNGLAFIKASTAEHFDTSKLGKEIANKQYELMCPDGKSAPLTEFRNCHWARLPSRVMVTSNYENEAIVESLRMVFLAVSDLYAKKPHLFRLFGEFNNKEDIIFKNAAKKLEILNPDLPLQQTFYGMLDKISRNNCS